MPGASHTTHTFPMRCLVVTPKHRSVKPYNGCVRSVILIRSVGGTVMSTGVVY
jgi:hypothetical protein